jgi:hypothetical protein
MIRAPSRVPSFLELSQVTSQFRSELCQLDGSNTERQASETGSTINRMGYSPHLSQHVWRVGIAWAMHLMGSESRH